MFAILAQTATNGSFPFVSVFFALIGGVLIGYFWGRSGSGPDIQRQLDEAAKDASEKAHRKAEEEKRQLEEAMTKLQGEKVFIERCLTDARLDLSRLESEQENASNALHESQLMVGPTNFCVNMTRA